MYVDYTRARRQSGLMGYGDEELSGLKLGKVFKKVVKGAGQVVKVAAPLAVGLLAPGAASAFSAFSSGEGRSQVIQTPPRLSPAQLAARAIIGGGGEGRSTPTAQAAGPSFASGFSSLIGQVTAPAGDGSSWLSRTLNRNSNTIGTLVGAITGDNTAPAAAPPAEAPVYLPEPPAPTSAPRGGAWGMGTRRTRGDSGGGGGSGGGGMLGGIPPAALIGGAVLLAVVLMGRKR